MPVLFLDNYGITLLAILSTYRKCTASLYKHRTERQRNIRSGIVSTIVASYIFLANSWFSLFLPHERRRKSTIIIFSSWWI